MVDGVSVVVRGRESRPNMAKEDRWSRPRSEVREMRNAETVLGVIRERGKQGLPLEDIYRQLYNPDRYLRAYARLYKNDGALTPGEAPKKPWMV